MQIKRTNYGQTAAKRNVEGGTAVKAVKISGQTAVKQQAARLEGSSTGPREMRDMLTMKKSKRHHASVKNWRKAGSGVGGVHQHDLSTFAH